MCFCEEILFQITGIENGWIFAEIIKTDAQIEISNSYLGGLHMPKYFLKVLIDLAENKERETWVTWHGESSKFLWEMKKEEELLELSIHESFQSLGTLSDEVICKNEKDNNCLFHAKTYFYSFALQIYEAFKAYSYGAGYNLWQNTEFADTFPRSELSQLKRNLYGRIEGKKIAER